VKKIVIISTSNPIKHSPHGPITKPAYIKNKPIRTPATFPTAESRNIEIAANENPTELVISVKAKTI